MENEWSPIDNKARRLKRMRCSILTAARLFQSDGSLRQRCWMVTLTYRPECEWSAKHVSTCLDGVRHWTKRLRTSFRYAWVLEQHKSGRIHYHLAIWLPIGITLPKFDRRGWWPHGMTQTVTAKFAPGYLAKYVSKGLDDAQEVPIPKGARLCGVGGLKDRALVEWRWWLMPKWAREAIQWMGQARRITGGFRCKLTDMFYPSPWETAIANGRAWYRRKSQPSWISLQTTCEIGTAHESRFSTCAWGSLSWLDA